VGGEGDAPGAEVGVGVGVEAHGEHAVHAGFFFLIEAFKVEVIFFLVNGDFEPGASVVVVAEPGVEGGGYKQWVPGEALEKPAASFYLFNDGGVESDTGVKEEVAVVDVAEADAFGGSGVDCVEEGAGGFNGVVGQADGAGKYVGGSSGECGECGFASGEAVGCFVEGAVATEDYHHVKAIVGGALCQPGGVPTPAGGGYFESVIGR